MIRNFSKIVNPWASKNRIKVDKVFWNRYAGNGMIRIRNQEFYYSSLKQLERLLKEHNCIILSIDVCTLWDEDDKPAIEIWVCSLD